MSLGVAAGGLPPVRGWTFTGESRFRISETRRKLGTFFNLTLLHTSTKTARDIIEVSFSEVNRLSDLLSRHEKGTPVHDLNRKGSIAHPPPELVELTRRSLEWNRKTGGFFDITVEPIVSLFSSHFDRHRTPPPEEKITELMPIIGSEHVRVEEDRIRFARKGVGITLDGIAKGYIVDRVVEIIRENGVRSALVNAGGDIRAIGGKEDGEPWKIAVQDPFRPDESFGWFSLAGGAIATSGNYQIFYDRERVFHHIVNPATGRSPSVNASSTVRSSLTVEADALSTALFVMDPAAGIEFIDGIDGVEGFTITRDGVRFVSGNWEIRNDFF